MHERTLNTWEQFTDELELRYRDHASRCVPHAYISSLLFRGHGDSTWKLKTTLERARPGQLSLVDYARIFYKIQPKLETLAGMKWETPTFEDYAAWANTLTPVSVGEWLAVPYLAYLRHHGFPSPLLDWTKSPYVAAFFAFRQLVEGATHASIWMYLESANSGKSATTGQPEIRGIGSRFAVHKRHFMQQSEYTVCTVGRNDDVFYAKHQDVFDRDDGDQDLLWKFNIPVSERVKVLTHLSKMNINAFSLFGSDDSLLEEMATTEFVLGQESPSPIIHNMLELRPTCEHCNTPLPPNSTEARMCSFECTFCAHCVEHLLHNVCPNCGGGFVARPIRPQQNWKGENFLGKYPAVSKPKHRPVNSVEHDAFAAALRKIPPEER